MLSKISTLILGVLYEKERNPYEITKMLKDLNYENGLALQIQQFMPL